MSNIQSGLELSIEESDLINGLNTLAVSGPNEGIAKTSSTTFENRTFSSSVGTLADVSTGSTDTAKSLYTMTSGVDVEFKSSDGNSIFKIDETNERILTGKLGILEGGATPTKYTIFQGGNQSVDITYTLPTTIGAAGTYLKDVAGDGVLSWSTVAGGGDVTKVGTPVNNQVGVWTGDGTLEGDANLTFDTATDTLTSVNINATTFTGALTGTASGNEVPLTFGDGLTRTVNDVDLDTTLNILKISGLTSNGFVKTSGGDGTLSVDTTAYAPIASPTFTGEVTIPNTGLHLLDTNASHDLIIKPGSDLTADRTLTVTTGDTDMIVNLTAVTDEYVLAYDTATNTWRGVAGGAGGGITNSAGANVITKSDGTNIVASALNEASAGVFSTTAGTAALSFVATAPTATTGASQVGIPLTLNASDAVASTDTAGAAVGGAVTITSGAAARLTSGNANGGAINLTTSAGIGTGVPGRIVFTQGTYSTKMYIGNGSFQIGANQGDHTPPTNTIALGLNAMYNASSATGVDNIAIGVSALRGASTGARNISVGTVSAYSGGDDTNGWTGVGISTGSDNTFLGYGASTTLNSITNTTAIGSKARTTVANSVVLGNKEVTLLQLGSDSSDTQTARVIRAAGARGGTDTDTAGSPLTISGGVGTGSATSAPIYFATGDAGASSSTAQTVTTKMTILGNGNVGIGTTAPSNLLHLSKTDTQTSGAGAVGLSITPTYNQASGTAANTDLLINRTQTAVGSGAQLLIDAQVGGVSKFSVSNAGAVTATSVSCSPTISSGTSAPATTPTKVGDIFVDTTNKKMYIATGTTNSSDWTITN